MVWAQAFPFVALLFYEEGESISKDTLTLFLIGSMGLWLLLNIAFLCTIDLSYLGTFLGTKTGSQYSCELFLTSDTDSAKFDMVFTVRDTYTASIHSEVRKWVAANVGRWKAEGEEWFIIEVREKRDERASFYETKSSIFA